MIKAKGVFFSYGDRYILEDASFVVPQNSIVGLVGPNGAGKSTLFKLLKREEGESQGDINVVGTIGHVPQEIKTDPTLDNASCVHDYIDPESLRSDHELEQMLRSLELDVALTQSNLKSLSGGQKTRLAIARALITKPDILLLDEPTNFLDTKGKEWVMNFLKSYPKTLIIVSHDLLLLDEVIDKVLFLNPQTHKIEEYKGNYTAYLEKKKEAEERLRREISEQVKKIKRMEKSLTKMARYSSEKGVRRKTQVRHRMEKLKATLPDLPQEVRRIKLNLPTPHPVGALPFNVKHIDKSYESQVLSDVSLYIERGERVALIGPNGAGKSTLIKIIMGIETPDRGEVTLDENVKIGYYSQEFDTIDTDMTVYDLIDTNTEWDEGRMRTFLSKFLFQGQKVFQKIETLSGGEKTRLSIALLVVKNYNLLILDEPTTYLDPLSQRVILDALKEYTGAMLIVSHTQEFIKELSPHRVLFLPENKIEFYSDDILERVEEM